MRPFLSIQLVRKYYLIYHLNILKTIALNAAFLLACNVELTITGNSNEIKDHFDKSSASVQPNISYGPFVCSVGVSHSGEQTDLMIDQQYCGVVAGEAHALGCSHLPSIA